MRADVAVLEAILKALGVEVGLDEAQKARLEELLRKGMKEGLNPSEVAELRDLVNRIEIPPDQALDWLLLLIILGLAFLTMGSVAVLSEH